MHSMVIGGANGLGRAISEGLCERGMVSVVDNDRDALTKFDDVQTLYADVITDEERIIEYMRDNPINALVYNVGIANGRTFLHLSDTARLQTFQANLFAPWSIAQSAAQTWIEHGVGGNIVFISSLHDRHIRTQPDYSTSKAALTMLMHEMAYELGRYGIRVNAVSPGGITIQDDDLGYNTKYPLGRHQTPREIAKAVLFLLNNDQAGMITGQNLCVDGGLDVYSWHAINNQQ